MERHAKNTNRLTTGKTVLQSVTKTGRPIFAYLRKSTKKKNQEDSIENQNNKVLAQVRSLGFKEEDIQRFEDAWITGFKDVKTKDGKIQSRPRDWFSSLLNAIDKVTVPCLLFAYDPSRLARNSNDGGVIIERLWYNGNKQKIEKIYFSMGDGVMWDSKTSKTDMLSSFILAEKESEKKGSYMKDNIFGNLEKKIYPPMIPTPPWLKATKNGLEITEQMQYIKRAMEMRIQGKSLETIHRYISIYWIKTPLSNITNTIFKNPLYIWEYELEGEIHENLIFVSGKQPISNAFFNDLQKCIGRKSWAYWEKQEEHLLPNKIKSESGLDFSLYYSKWKYRNYNGTYIDSNGNRKMIHITEENILVWVAREVEKIIVVLTQKIFWEKQMIQKERFKKSEKEAIIAYKWESYYTEAELEEIVTEELGKRRNHEFSIWEIYRILRLNDNNIALQINEKKLLLAQFYIDGIEKFWPNEAYSIENYEESAQKIAQELETLLEVKNQKMRELIEQSDYFKELKEKAEVNKIWIEVLLERKSRLESDIKDIRARYRKLGYSSEEAEEDSKEYQKEIEGIDGQIKNLSESADVSLLFEKLPIVLAKIFELFSNTINKAKVIGSRADFQYILEIIAFELQISTKKELKIKLLDGIDDILFLNGAPDITHLRTFVENYDRIAEKYNFSNEKNYF